MSSIYVVTINKSGEKKAFTLMTEIYKYYTYDDLRITYDWLQRKIARKGIHESNYVIIEKIELIKGKRQKTE